LKLNRTTRYALYAAMEMASTPDEQITVGRVAARYRIPEGALAKVFQQLVRSGIALGTRGVGGGYRLSRPRRKITVQEVISAFEPPRTAGSCLLERPEEPCTMPTACRLGSLFDEVDELVRCTFESVTLDTLVR